MIDMAQIDYINYWNHFYGNKQKGLESLQNILTNKNQAEKLLSNEGGMAAIFKVGTTRWDNDSIMDYVLGTQYASIGAKTWYKSATLCNSVESALNDAEFRKFVLAHPKYAYSLLMFTEELSPKEIFAKSFGLNKNASWADIVVGGSTAGADSSLRAVLFAYMTNDDIYSIFDSLGSSGSSYVSYFGDSFNPSQYGWIMNFSDVKTEDRVDADLIAYLKKNYSNMKGIVSRAPFQEFIHNNSASLVAKLDASSKFTRVNYSNYRGATSYNWHSASTDFLYFYINTGNNYLYWSNGVSSTYDFLALYCPSPISYYSPVYGTGYTRKVASADRNGQTIVNANNQGTEPSYSGLYRLSLYGLRLESCGESNSDSNYYGLTTATGYAPANFYRIWTYNGD